MRKIICWLLFLGLFYGVYGKQVITLRDVNLPIDLIVKNNDVIIAAEKRILYYSLKPNSFKNIIGSYGHGPGEYLEEPKIGLVGNSKTLCVHCEKGMKLIFYKLSGELIKERRLPGIGRTIIIGDKIINRQLGYAKDSFKIEVKLLDNIGNKKRLDTYLMPNPLKEYDCMPYARYFQVYKDKIYISKPKQGGFIFDVFNKNGEIIKNIDKFIKKQKITSDIIKQNIAAFDRKIPGRWSRIKKSAKFPEFVPLVKHFKINDNTIIIKTWFRKNKDVEYIFYDLDNDKYITRYLPDADNLYFYDCEKFYYIFENEDDEVFELHSISVKF